MKKNILALLFLITSSFCFSQTTVLEVTFCGVENNDTTTLAQVSQCDSLSMVVYRSGNPVTGYTFTGGEVVVSEFNGKGKILAGGKIDPLAKALLKHSAGHDVIFTFNYQGPDGIKRLATLQFFVSK